MNDLGRLLADLRKRSGLSQTEVAERANLSGGYLSQLESGARGERIPRVTIERLASALGVDKRILLSAAGMRINANDVAVYERPRLEDFIETEPTLNPSEKSLLLSLIHHFRANPTSPNPINGADEPSPRLASMP